LKAIINACIYDFHNYKQNCYILFDKEIIEVGHMQDFKGGDEIYDARGCIIMPGLTNCHTHIYSTFSRGMSIPFNPKNFKEILEQLWWKLDSKLDKNDIYLSGLVYGIDCIKSGVTSIIDHHASGLSIRGSLQELKRSICDELGLRGIFCFETSDRFDVDECIEENIEFSRQRTESSAGVFGMHASMSLSDGTLEKI
jgi:cytosine/adenosine deaminase-related metal-dependent hydrolase